MIKIFLVSIDLIIGSLNTEYAMHVTSLEELYLGADQNSRTFRVIDSGQTAYFVKLTQAKHVGVDVAKFLYDSNIKNVVLPIKTTTGELYSTFEDCTLIVYPFIEGCNGFTQPLQPDQWMQFGKVLRQIHGLRVPASLKKCIKKETFSLKWQKAITSLYVDLASAPVNDEIAIKFAKFLNENKSRVLELVEKSEVLHQKLNTMPLEFVLCHGDIHAGNILLDSKQQFFIIDWDDAILAPKERDLMFIGGAVGNVWNHPSEEALFYSGYNADQINRQVLAYYRFVRILEDIAEYSQQMLFTNESVPNKQVSLNHFMGMFEPNGVVDQAFNTLKVID